MQIEAEDIASTNAADGRPSAFTAARLFLTYDLIFFSTIGGHRFARRRLGAPVAYGMISDARHQH